MIPSAEHLAHLKYIQKTIWSFYSDPDKSLWCAVKALEFLNKEIADYENMMEEAVKCQESESIEEETLNKHYVQEAQGCGQKWDKNKQKWYAMPMSVLKPLADVYAGGEAKGYATFNCLQPFEDGDRRFWDAIMRHLEECQMDSLAIDKETGCYHLAAVCFNALHRLHNALQQKKEN